MATDEKVKSKKSWKDALKGVFVVVPEDPANKGVVENTKESTTPDPVETVSFSAEGQSKTFDTPTFSGSGAIDNNLAAKLRNKLEADTTIPKPNYMDIITSTRSMANIPGMTEQVKFLSAYSVLNSRDGLTKESLARSGELYIRLLDQEEVVFENSMKDAMLTTVTSRENEVAEIEKTIAKLGKQVEEIEIEIERLKQKGTELVTVISVNKAKITDKERIFKVTITSLREEIKTNLEKVKEYIN